MSKSTSAGVDFCTSTVGVGHTTVVLIPHQATRITGVR